MATNPNYVPLRLRGFQPRKRRIFPGDRRLRPQAVKLQEAYENRVRVGLDALQDHQWHFQRFDLQAQAVLNMVPFPALFPEQAPSDRVLAGVRFLSAALPSFPVRTLADLAARASMGLVPLADVPDITRRALIADGTIHTRKER